MITTQKLTFFVRDLHDLHQREHNGKKNVLYSFHGSLGSSKSSNKHSSKERWYLYEVWNSVCVDLMRMTFKDVGMQSYKCSKCSSTSNGDLHESMKKKTF